MKFPILKTVLLSINGAVLICYLLACLVPFVHTGTLWFIALCGLIFPVLFFILCGFVVFWLLLRSKWWVISLVVVLLGFKQISSTFAFHFPGNFSQSEKSDRLRILHWNVSDWNLSGYPSREISQEKMIALIQDQEADVLCFQEFYEPEKTKNSTSVIEAFQKIGFPYYYFVPSKTFSRAQSGIGIFSRYPLENKKNIEFTGEPAGEHLLQADIQVNGKKIRIMTTHLQSVQFNEYDIENIDRLKKGKNKKLEGSRTLVSKLKRGFGFRYEQATLVKRKIEESPYPVIITGDFNDVPSSSTYFLIKGKLQDTFLRKGSFIGRTYRYISPTLRIDYILADKSFKVEQFKRLKVNYSDHYSLVTDLQLTRKK